MGLRLSLGLGSGLGEGWAFNEFGEGLAEGVLTKIECHCVCANFHMVCMALRLLILYRTRIFYHSDGHYQLSGFTSGFISVL